MLFSEIKYQDILDFPNGFYTWIGEGYSFNVYIFYNSMIVMN